MDSQPVALTANYVQFTAGNVAVLLLFACACCHSAAAYLYSYYRLIFGTLYPSYASYKAIKNKDIKEYVSTTRMLRNLLNNCATRPD